MESYELRRGAYKNLTLRLVPPDGSLRVSAPWFVPKLLIDQFVAEKAAWIARRRATMVPSQGAAPTPNLSEGAPVAVWGRIYPLHIESPGRLPRVVVDHGAGRVVLRVPASWGADRWQACLERWEDERVAEALEVLVPEWARRTGLVVKGWRVKRLRSRWGSCRPDTGTLVFNARLGAFPPTCLEHVVVHELAHLVVPHHGPKFHALVESWLPGAAEARALLRAGPFAVASRDASPGRPSISWGETPPSDPR